MAQLIELNTFASTSGQLTVFDTILPGAIQRVFYIYNVGDATRAGHRHKKTWNALVCLNGSCRVYNNNGDTEETFVLNDPTLCLVLEPKDWHLMDTFSSAAILLVVSNQLYDRTDYIDEPYPTPAGPAQP